MCKSFGHLEGTVTKINNDSDDIEVRSSRGITCYVSELYKRLHSLEVGMKLTLEEASVQFDNGRILYIVDENLRGVSLNDVCLEDGFMK